MKRAIITTTLSTLADTYLGKGKTGRVALGIESPDFGLISHIYRGYGQIHLERHENFHVEKEKGSMWSIYSGPARHSDPEFIFGRKAERRFIEESLSIYD